MMEYAIKTAYSTPIGGIKKPPISRVATLKRRNPELKHGEGGLHGNRNI
jgi:hypothetical protein